MPQSTPAGGLSLIIHILINIIVFTYNKLIKFLKLPKKNFVSKSFTNLANKKGDTFARRLLSYSLVSVVFVIMGGNFILITFRLFELEDIRVTTKIENIIAEKYGQFDSNSSVSSEETKNTINYTPIEFVENQSQIVTQGINNNIVSLVDYMRLLGIIDTSFKARAELAVQSGVINSINEYNGSLSQNREIIKKLQSIPKYQLKME